ncbi:MAG: hypothetical protein K9J83_01495 [Desulfarculaceae bacterium]|nr:hypothetical protein [Desulfarculaceae bacterium]
MAAAASALLTTGSILLIGQVPIRSVPAFLSGDLFATAVQAADFALLGLFLFFGIRFKDLLITGLSAAQIAGLFFFEFVILADSHAPAAGLYCDSLSLVMVLLICIAGSLIVLYALPYMQEHERHLKPGKSRNPVFFSLLFVFIAAMNALVLVNDLMLFYFCFEITTLCSFLLIGHDRTRTARENAGTALRINSMGGAVLLLGIVLIYTRLHTLDIQEVIARVQGTGALLIPLGLLCVAGFTKAAQMPFQKWLLGAMVAPTPVSALLHSATMVKAGVYLVIRFAPAFAGTFLSTGVAVCGAFTFLSAAALAVGQSNGKKVLAYSTVSNLGLILACVGINTRSALSAAILLMIFHAVSKALLFLCMGSVEQHIKSRDIEDMRGLFGEMPKVAPIITMGILTMILPPFGMLLGKWMAIESAAGNLFLLFMLAMGSALTVVYWARWAGILMGSDFRGKPRPERLHVLSTISLFSLLGLAILLSVSAPFFHTGLLPGSITGAGGFAPVNGSLANSAGSFAVIPLFLAAAASFLFALAGSGRSSGAETAAPYMSGIAGPENGTYIGPMNRITRSVNRNYYLSAFFGEQRLSGAVNACAGILILLMMGACI